MTEAERVDSKQDQERDELACCRELARIFKGLGNATRLGILRRIMEGRMCVSELQSELDRSQPNISQHLAVLRERGIVESEREGTRVCYRLADTRLGDLLELAAEVFEIEHIE